MIRQKPIPHCYRIVARAHDIQAAPDAEKRADSCMLSPSQEHVTPGYVSRLLRLSSLGARYHHFDC